MLVTCPWCKDIIWIEELNCRIFRHGIIKNTFTQMNPHSTEDECIKLVSNNLIFGCGGPFMVSPDGYCTKCTFEDKVIG